MYVCKRIRVCMCVYMSVHWGWAILKLYTVIIQYHDIHLVGFNSAVIL